MIEHDGFYSFTPSLLRILSAKTGSLLVPVLHFKYENEPS